MQRRVVISGMGAVTPIGNTLEDYWQGLLDGRVGTGPVTLFDASDYPTRIAAEVKDFAATAFIDRKEARMMARGTQFAVAAAAMTLEDAGWETAPGDERLGVVTGISQSPQDAIESAIEQFQRRRFSRKIPYALLKSFAHSASSEVGRLTGFQSSVMTISTACSSGLNAVGYAMKEIREGHADALLCLATDSLISKYSFAYFCQANLLSQRNDDPAHASRPFDAMRDGGVLGEGAGCLLMEDMEHALRRGADIYAEVIGAGSSGFGYQTNGRAGEALVDGMTLAMEEAMAMANCSPRSIDYIGSHGASDKILDLHETMAVKRTFGEAAYRIPMSSIKAQIGIPTCAAGMLQLISTILAMRHAILPATMNYEYPDKQCDLDYIPNVPRRNAISRALVLAHGLNGSDSCILVGKVVKP